MSNSKHYEARAHASPMRIKPTVGVGLPLAQVLRKLPKLRKIDGVPVEPEEREAALTPDTT